MLTGCAGAAGCEKSAPSDGPDCSEGLRLRGPADAVETAKTLTMAQITRRCIAVLCTGYATWWTKERPVGAVPHATVNPQSHSVWLKPKLDRKSTRLNSSHVSESRM